LLAKTKADPINTLRKVDEIATIRETFKACSICGVCKRALNHLSEKPVHPTAIDDSLKAKRTKIITEISSGKELLQELKKSVKLIKENESRLKEIEKQIKQNEKTIEKLAIFTSALKSTQSELRNLMIDTINQAMAEIWEKIYPYKDFSNVRISVNEGSYEIEVKQNTGQWQRVEGILSGGERNSVAITLRIVISLVLTQNLGWIILDEPTHNLDSTAVRELSETMRNHLPELIEQIFLITHDKEMENAASGKLYYFERDKENMSITKIE